MSEPGASPADRETALHGGSMGSPVRVGDTVRRDADAWSPTVQRLLQHLSEHGVTVVPRPMGTDERGRDSVSYLPGVVPQYPFPDWVWDEGVLVDAARHLARVHDASAAFDTTGASWQLPAHEPAEVVCHNDFAPYNMVFTDGRLVGVIDWDTASPGPRVWDLAYLAYRIVPLTDPTSGHEPVGGLRRRSERLRLLCDTYGGGMRPADVLVTAVRRLEDLAAFTEARADAGQEELRSHVHLYRRDAAWIAARLDDLDRAAP